METGPGGDRPPPHKENAMSRQEPYPAYGWPAPRQSVVGTFLKCTATVAVVGILCGTGVVMGTLGMATGRAGSLLHFANQALKDLPTALRETAPVLADAMNDYRDPGYVKSVELTCDVDGDSERSTQRAVIEVRNAGEQVVSVLAIRAVYLDHSGRPMGERIVYGATPLAVEDEWRGPLFPGVKRRIAVRCPSEAAKVELEVSELRVWQPDDADDASLEDGAAADASARRVRAAKPALPARAG